jgi:trimeric autotransporter adhesin
MSCTGLILSLALMTAGMATAQVEPLVISTYAGGPSTMPVTAVNAAIGSPQGIATDAAGNVYFTSLSNDSPAYYHGRFGVFKLDRNGILTRIAGNTGYGYSGDGGPAIDAQFRLSNYDDDEAGLPGIAVDGAGNVYIADSGNYRVRKVSSAGIITTVAGNGISGNSGDGGPAINAQLDYPSGLAVDSAGNLYIASGDRVRKVSPDGTITSAVTGFDGAIAVDNAGNLFVAGGGSVLKVLPSGVSMEVASEDGLAMAVDDAGNIYLTNTSQVRRITPDGNAVTVAGTNVCGYSGDGGPATSAKLCVYGLAIDRQGNLYLADAGNLRIREVSTAGVINTVAGNGNCCYSGDGGPASSALLNLAPWGGGMAVDSGGNLYVADAANQRVRKISPSGIITTVAGNGVSNGYSGDGGLATNAQLNYPSGVAVDSGGTLYIADVGNVVIRKVSPSGIISTVAQGGGRALAIDQADNLYFEDAIGVRKVSPSGIVTTFITTQFNLPFGAAVDGAGNLYIAEAGAPNYRVRKITPAGIITTVAGNGTAGYSGDGGPAASAQLNGPVGLAVDSAGDLYIADSFNARIRMVSPSGIITTVAGNGASGYSGDGGPAANAQLGSLSGLAIDSAGNLYAADQYFNAIRLLQPASSSIVVSGVVNAASYVAGAIAPGELVVVTGTGLGPVQLVSAAPGGDGLYAAQLAGTSVSVNGLPAPLIYTSATQVAAIVPDSVSLGSAQVTVSYHGQASASFPVSVVPSAPGIFTADSTGSGHAASIDQNGLIDVPAHGGDVITLFVTGMGPGTPAFLSIYSGDPLQMMIPISVGDAQGTAAGVTQIKVPIGNGLDCDVPVVVQVGNTSSQPGVTIAIALCI